MVRAAFEAEPTRPYPVGKSRSGWVVDTRIAPSLNGIFWEFEYQVYEDQATKDAQLRPFFIVNHKAQLRTDHQRIVLGPNGGPVHIDAGEVLPEDVDAFLASNRFAYVFNPADGLWHRRQDDFSIAPVLFNSAPWSSLGGLPEGLDPQWQRENVTLTIAEQIPALIQARLDRVEANQESGDKRGTTLNLQVGAGADDGVWWEGTTSFFNGVGFGQAGYLDSTNTAGNVFLRFTSITIPNGATINTAVLTLHADASNSAVVVNWRMSAIDADSAAAPTTYSGAETATRTTATVDFSGVAAWSAGDNKTFSGLESIYQELVDRGGWSSGNNAVHYTEDNGSTTLTGRIRKDTHYDGDTASAAKLDIDYTAGGGGTAVQDIIGSGIIPFAR